jgi:hypothetical protein
MGPRRHGDKAMLGTGTGGGGKGQRRGARRPRSLPLRGLPEERIHSEPLSDREEDMLCELHTVLALLNILERGTGALPTDTFVDGSFTSSELHALSLAARDRLKVILGHAPG